LLKLRGYEFDEKSFLSAATRGDLFAVSNFLAAGINPNAKDQDGDTALTSAAARGDSKIVHALLLGKADVNAKGRNGWTALLLAQESERNDVADELLAQPNIDLKAEEPQGMTALMLSVWHQRVATVRQLLDRGVDVNHQDKDGDTAVHGAATRTSCDPPSRGANPNASRTRRTALMWAASSGRDEIVRVIDKRRIRGSRTLVVSAAVARRANEDIAVLRDAKKRCSAVSRRQVISTQLVMILVIDNASLLQPSRSRRVGRDDLCAPNTRWDENIGIPAHQSGFTRTGRTVRRGPVHETY
jgi:ankyrin repeat protein